jgi:predicted regulator of Ras-like GTPase activity (Roadblock/LC7/MglB family)
VNVSNDFEKTLETLVTGLPGAQLATLCGLDGIGISSFRNPESVIDPMAADAEFATVLGAARRSVQSIAVGEIQETILASEKTVIVLQGVGTEFILGVVLDAKVGTLGLARLKVRRVAEEFTKALAG